MLLQAKNVWKTYGSGDTRVDALRGVDLTVEKGDFVALVGPSGSGKSSLLHVLGAMDTPSSGQVSLEGEDLFQLREKQLTELRLHKIGFVFQTFNLIQTLNAVDNVALPMKLAGLPKRQAIEKAFALLEKVGLQERASHLPVQLSGGQKQRVAIARALANDPPLILADEPTGNLDSHSGETIIELMQAINKEGCTILMVTHNQELADRVGRRIIMRDGKLTEPSRQAAAV